MKDCARYAPLIGAREGELTETEARALAGHLSSCGRCQAYAADLAATEGMVSEALLAQAATRDFGPFVDQVMERIGDAAPVGSAASARPPRAGRTGRRGLFGWLELHWKGTLAAAAPALAAAAVFLYVQTGGAGRPQVVASLELASEGNVATVLQTLDGPVVLLAPEEHGT
jgi:anti-sigma factor RsiW